MKSLLCSASLFALIVAPAYAQEQKQPDQATQQEQTQPQTQVEPKGVIVLSEWRYDPLYASGWSVDQAFDEATVVGENGDEIGDIENIIFDRDGNAVALIAEVGGFWDIGDTHVSIPWGQVQISEDAARFTVPVTEENADDFAAAGDRSVLREGETGQVSTVDDDLATGPDLFKATDIIGDTAFLNNAERYGYLNDIIVNDGKLAAVVADTRAYGRGYYAYPYTGPTAWRDPARYTLPYGAEDVAVLQVFDYSQMQRKGATDASTQDAGTTSSTEPMPEAETDTQTAQ
ncbi:MAG: PRC-barrel domain-containing protein [Ensifer alkalisoli]|nr:PRC-barrel domain-containing protein [Sinorhizobium alkalisoli]